MRQPFGVRVVVLLTAATAIPALGQAQLKNNNHEKFADLRGDLVITRPVSLYGAPNEESCSIKVHDLVLLQLRYPISPPMPVSVQAASLYKHVEFVQAAKTPMEVALLERKPRKGGIVGVGYIQVLARGASAGKDQLTVRLKLADGKVKSVSYAFEVKDNE